MLDRIFYGDAVQRALDRAPITYLAGPRQIGKTTLARTFLMPDNPGYFDLEDPISLARLADPLQALNQNTPLTVIDEIQRWPDLFPILRVLADSPQRRTQWLILGSASPTIIKGVSESLAGRVELVNMGGFDLSETGPGTLETLWLRGGFPRSYLAASDSDSLVWRKQFLNLVVERDLAALGVSLPATTPMRLLSMMAHWHGQIWNAAEPARSLGISETTVRRLTDFFEGLYLIRLLRPWHANLAKRQVKTPKLYLRDSGLCNALLGIGDRGTLVSHPKSGAVWEGLVVEDLVRRYRPDEVAFWATHNGAELDLLLVKDSKRYGFEIIFNTAPTLTPSMKISLTELNLETLIVVHPGTRHWPMAERIVAWGLEALPEALEVFGE
jgi:predicted AAA+ superfamily ATPase